MLKKQQNLNKVVKVFVKVLSMFMVIGLLLSTSNSIAKEKKILRIANGGDITSLDPQRISGDWEHRVVGDAFEGLMKDGPNSEILPGMALSYKVSSDGLTYTFKLRKAKWSDGTELTAKDFVYAFRRLINPETAAKYAWLMFTIKNAEDINTGKIKNINELGVKAISDYSLEIKLSKPAPYFISSLAHFTSFPIPMHIVEKHGDNWVKPENIVVNGAFLPTEWVPGSHVKSIKNVSYYEAKDVDLEEVYYFVQEDNNAALRSYLAGEYDILTAIPDDKIAELRKKYPKELRIAPFSGIYYYVLNSNNKVLKNPDVRKALNLAIDRELLVEKITGSGQIPAYSFVPPGMPSYPKVYTASWKSWPQAKKDKEAKRLMKKAGYDEKNPVTLVLSYNTSESHKRIAVAISQMWRKIGVKIELLNTEVKVHYENLTNNDFEVGRAGWLADYIDPENFLSLLRSTNTGNYGRWTNKKFDDLYTKAEATVDIEKRAKIYYQAEKLVIEESALIPIYYYVSKDMVKPFIKNYNTNIKDNHPRRWLKISK